MLQVGRDEKWNVRVEIIRFVSTYQPGIVEFKLTDAYGCNWYFIEKQALLWPYDLDHEDDFPQPGWTAYHIVERFVDGTGRNIVRIDIEQPWSVCSIEGEHVFDILANQIEDPPEAIKRMQQLWDSADGPHPFAFHLYKFADRRSMLSHIEYHNISDVIEEDHAVNWGCFVLPKSGVIVVGFNQTGLTPQGVVFDSALYIGVGGFCACYDLASSSRRFLHRMPTLFHEFVRFKPWLIVQDEIGFVGLDANGKQRWCRILGDSVEAFELDGSRLKGRLMSGAEFALQIPD